MTLEDIIFYPTFKEENHSRMKSFQSILYTNNPDFANYHLAFERLFAEVCLIRGDNISLVNLPIQDNTEDSSLFSLFMGVNKHSRKRVEMSQEFFATYEKHPDSFLSLECEQTEYYRYYKEWIYKKATTPRNPLKKAFKNRDLENKIRQHVKDYVMMFDNIKKHGTLVGNSKSIDYSTQLTCYDLPWCFKYHNYYKERDGAHRRAILKYLGMKEIPTLVFDFNEINEEFVAQKSSLNYIVENFKWYQRIINKNVEYLTN